MKISFNPDSQDWLISVNYQDVAAATPGTAAHLWLALGKIIFNKGNLPVKNWTLTVMKDENEQEFLEIS